MTRFLRLVFSDAIADGFMVVGAVLLVVALRLGVNPADGSVVDASVRGTWIPVFLFFATLPAMATMFVTAGGVIGLPLMFLVQLSTYWLLGRGVSWLLSVGSRTEAEGSSPPPK
jgi:hypothetical protein